MVRRLWEENRILYVLEIIEITKIKDNHYGDVHMIIKKGIYGEMIYAWALICFKAWMNLVMCLRFPRLNKVN